MSRSREYWIRRIRQEQERQLQSDNEIKKALSDLYAYHLREIEKELHAFESRYASKQGLTLGELTKRVDAFDVQAFQEKARRYVETRDFSDIANRELSLFNYKMKYNRMEMLLDELSFRLYELADDEA